MISVILYGRNDSHGYNLHKRGAISLNCIAEVLEDDNDEIIFVDYNSPDQIPTFPEAIADTLTDKATKLLRIIRVRESYHRQFAGKTHLVALESQSRNIAARRANTANRWILSTNTDMIFVPRAGNRSLTDSIGRLSDGFYHLPRFEIPENLWELLDRRSPAKTISQVEKWGRQLHLNEIVFGNRENVFDAPGDFQLFLREDLERIGGFDESMIRGWHVDSNIAKRMHLLRGEVYSAVDQVFGYHCGHTRQPTTLHRSGFVANSLDTYVRDVTDPVLHGQLASWGAPDQIFEERSVARRSKRRAASVLEKAIKEPGPETSEVVLNDDSFDANSYDPNHVLPHLINLLGEMPPGQFVTLVGEDKVLFGQFAAALNGLGLAPRLQWIDGDPDCGFAEKVLLDEGIARADLFVLQFPAQPAEQSDSWQTARWQVQLAMEQIFAAEQLRTVGERRLLVLINASHTPLQNTFQPAMTYTAIPYTARLRHGFVSLPQLDESKAGHRLHPFHDDDVAMVRQIARQTNAPAGWQRLALELPAMFAQAGVDRNTPGVANMLERGSETLEAAVRRCLVPPENVVGRDVAASRLCSSVDWENRDWFALADRCFSGNSPYAQSARSRWSWERVGLLHNLRSHVSESTRPWILVVTNGADHLPAFAAHFGYRVAYTTYASFICGEPCPAAGWDDQLKIWHMINHADVMPLEQAQARGVSQFEAVVIAGTDISAKGPEQYRAVASRLAELATPDAFVSFAVLVHLNKGTGQALSFPQWQSACQPDGILMQAGLFPVGKFDSRIPLDCAVRFAHEDQTQYVPGLSFGWGDSMVTLGIINSQRSRPETRSAVALAEQGGPENANDSDAAQSPIPESVMSAARLALGHTFACRLVEGIERDVTRFVTSVATEDGLSWTILPIAAGSAGQMSIRLGSPGLFVGLVDASGAITGAISGQGGSNTHQLRISEASLSRQVLVMASEPDGAFTIVIS